VTSVLFLPTLDGPRLADAVEDALVRGRGDVLANARVRSTKAWLGIGIERVEVVGDVVALAGEAPAGGAAPAAEPEAGLEPGAGAAAGGRPFHALATGYVPLLGYASDETPRVHDVEADAVGRHLLWISTRGTPPRLAEAIDAALRRGDGDLLIDASVERRWWGIPFLYLEERWHVEGDAVRAPQP
jgi:hypothetical protein